MNKKKLVQISRILISVMFILSAITKLLSLHFFDDLMSEVFLGKSYENEYGGVPIGIQFFSRLIISGELLLGAAILQHKYLKKIILPTIMVMLVGFTMHLFYISFSYMSKGRTAYDAFFDGNCGCFGDIIPMSNFESILKNVIAFALTFYVWKKFTDEKELRLRSWVMPVTVGVVTLLTLLLTIKTPVKRDVHFTTFAPKTIPTESIEKEDVKIEDTISVIEQEVAVVKETKSKQVVKQSVIEKPSCFLSEYTNFSDGVQANLCEGEKLVCMFSLTCSHCQSAYRDLVSIYDENTFPDTYLMLNGAEQTLTYFFNQAGGQHPYVRIEEYLEFKRLLDGKGFPRILVLKDGEIVKEWDIESYSKKALGDYFKVKVEDKGAQEEETDGLISPDGLW